MADTWRIEFNHLLDGYGARMEVLPNGEMRYSKNPVVDALIRAIDDKSIDKVKRCQPYAPDNAQHPRISN